MIAGPLGIGKHLLAHGSPPSRRRIRRYSRGAHKKLVDAPAHPRNARLVDEDREQGGLPATAGRAGTHPCLYRPSISRTCTMRPHRPSQALFGDRCIWTLLRSCRFSRRTKHRSRHRTHRTAHLISHKSMPGFSRLVGYQAGRPRHGCILFYYLLITTPNNCY